MRPLVEKWAAANGYTRVLLVPAPLRTAEDASNVSRRKSADIVHMRPDFLGQHVVSSPFFTLMVGLVEKPPWKRDSCEESFWQWAEDTYQDNIAVASGWWELSQWDDEGPLLLDRIPGLDTQAPPGEKWLFVVSPALCGVSGDLQGMWRILGLQQYACPWCLKRDFTDWSAVEFRDSPLLVQRVNDAFSTLFDPKSNPDELKTATDFLMSCGFRKYNSKIASSKIVVPAFLRLPQPSWRLPHTGKWQGAVPP